MAAGKLLYRLITVVENHSLNQDFLNYLPTPDYIENIIHLTNLGLIKEALSSLERTEYVFNQLNSEFNLEEREWYSTIIHQLRLGVTTARD